MAKKMKKSDDVGLNRTGMAASPIDSKAMLQSSHDAVAAVVPAEPPLEALRAELASLSGPVGTVPVPTTLKGLAETAAQALTGDKASVLIDKLGERLAFERTGTRLYEALLAKFAATPATEPGGPSRAEIEEIRNDERRHFELIRRAMVSIGADPTAQTPAADLEGVASMGLLQIVCDPRTTVRESLQAIHHAEAADNDGWTLLIALAKGFGQDDLATQFEAALQVEEQHLARVRLWLSEMVQQAAFGETLQPVGA